MSDNSWQEKNEFYNLLLINLIQACLFKNGIELNNKKIFHCKQQENRCRRLLKYILTEEFNG
jgi:hypothetical protein